MKSINIPINGVDKIIKSEHSFVIIGANGSGKSHLGAYIENHNSENVLRISAQRALSIPDNITIKSEESSWNTIFYGNETQKNKGYKWEWGKFTTKLVDDYASVLSAIFTRQSNEHRNYFNDCRQHEINGQSKQNTPSIITDKVIDIWNSIFPHREIIFEDAKIKARVNGINEYYAKDMSDGERVAIYLIGQCLVAHDNMTLIIDEPEIHLHKSIMRKLWDKIEEYCPDKIFVYITHDLDFAASRKDAKKIWVKSYNRTNDQVIWDVQVLNDNDVIPDSLMIEVLGNRKNVLFVEGEKRSYDNQLYPYIYEDYYVIPCHNCSKVIEMTKAFNEEKVKSLHNVFVKGLIDRDYMTDREVTAYKNQNIYTLDVAEVENLYLIEDIMRIVAENQAIENIDEILSNIKKFIFEEFNKEKDLQIALMCEKEILYKLKCYKKSANTVESLKEQLNVLFNNIDVDAIYSKTKSKVDNILNSNNLDNLLKIYNRKSLHTRISSFFNFQNGEYPKLVLRLLKTDKKQSIVNAIKKFTPQL